jgi:phosphopantetheinyl transferase
MVVLLEPSTNLPSMNKPVLNDDSPLYFGVSHWYEKVLGIVRDREREEGGWGKQEFEVG